MIIIGPDQAARVNAASGDTIFTQHRGEQMRREQFAPRYYFILKRQVRHRMRGDDLVQLTDLAPGRSDRSFKRHSRFRAQKLLRDRQVPIQIGNERSSRTARVTFDRLPHARQQSVSESGNRRHHNHGAIGHG